MSHHSNGCLVCGSDLVYSAAAEWLTCTLCGSAAQSHAACAGGHYVCDACHGGSAVELVTALCASEPDLDPIAAALRLMTLPSVRMHGPEHHFLVPAVLIAAVRKARNELDRLADDLELARTRSSDVKGGVCGLHGCCGAAIGCGIAMSVLTGATPLSEREWALGQNATATALSAIAAAGGPRCCKRDVFLALQATLPLFNVEFGVALPAHCRIVCLFSQRNRECKSGDCLFYGEAPRSE